MQIKHLHNAILQFWMVKKVASFTNTTAKCSWWRYTNNVMPNECADVRTNSIINYKSTDFVLECAWLTSLLGIMLFAYFSMLFLYISLFIRLRWVVWLSIWNNLKISLFGVWTLISQLCSSTMCYFTWINVNGCIWILL